jgi:1-acyl-sn-glycerol-3-phosphate acyltransferase
MTTTTVKLLDIPITGRKNLPFFIARFLAVGGYKLLTEAHTEISEELFQKKNDKNEKTVFLYTALHKSLWEATGIMVPLYLAKLPVPYAGMGDNLVRGKFFRSVVEQTGVFLVKRASNRSEMLESAKKLKDYTLCYLAHGKDVLIFPEGTRKSILNQGKYGKFFPTAFEALLEYEKNKNEIAGQYPGLTPHNVYIVPTNVDYTKVREDWEMIEEYKGTPPTLRVWDSLKMIKHIRETYISFGNPIKVSDYMDKDRKTLAVLARDKCLELVKILPINIAACAVLDSKEGDRIDLSKIEDNIASHVKKLTPFKDRFRGFDENDSPAQILEKVTRYENCFKSKNIDIKNLDFYRLYANYIGHYYPSALPVNE